MPPLVVVALKAAFVSRCNAVTSTPGTTAPVGSETTPVMAPWPPCPNAGAARDKLATKMIAMQNSLVLIIPLLLIAEADRPKRSTANPVQSLVRNVS